MRSSAGQVDETVDPAQNLTVQIATNVAVRGMAVIRDCSLPDFDLTYGQANSAPRDGSLLSVTRRSQCP